VIAELPTDDLEMLPGVAEAVEVLADALNPRNISLSMATIDGDHSKSGVVRAAKPSTSVRLKASIARVATSTFCSDIA
jgi:hypothetical protein